MCIRDSLNIGHFSNGTFIGTYGDDGGAADLIRFGTHSGDERMRINTDSILFNTDSKTGIDTSTTANNEHFILNGMGYVLDPDVTGITGRLAYTISPSSYQPSIKSGTDKNVTSGGTSADGSFPNTAADSDGFASATEFTLSLIHISEPTRPY